jgi:hypothetical protein
MLEKDRFESQQAAKKDFRSLHSQDDSRQRPPTQERLNQAHTPIPFSLNFSAAR